MKRLVAVLLSLLLALIGLATKADANAGAACVISGTINFAPAATAPTHGTWRIEPAVISCEGLFRSFNRIIGPGTFTGSGTYSEVPGGTDGCLHHVGSGDVEYRIHTTEADVRINEPHKFVVAVGGAFTTPSLNGSFLVTPPYQGNCVAEPVTRASFVAQGLLVRLNGVDR